MTQNILGQMIDQLSREKNVESKVIVSALEDAMVAAARRYFKTNEDFHARFVPESNLIEVFSVKRVVDQVTNPNLEMSLEEALQIDETLQINDTIEMPKPTEALGRIAAQTAKQVIYQKVREAERDTVQKEYGKRMYEMVTGIVKRFEGPDAILDMERIEAVMPLREQGRNERLKPGDRVKVVILRVGRTGKDPQVIVSRAHPALIKRLFEIEVPEIRDGIVIVKEVAREPGERTKIAVTSVNRDIDPVGACVGIKGVRINAITRELRDEKIDIIQWSDDSLSFAANALSPAKVSKVIVVDSQSRVLEVIVEKAQLSLAIGKKGQNVRLASRLLGWEINVKSEEEKRKEVQTQIDLIVAGSQAADEVLEERADVVPEVDIETAADAEAAVDGETAADGEATADAEAMPNDVETTAVSVAIEPPGEEEIEPPVPVSVTVTDEHAAEPEKPAMAGSAVDHEPDTPPANGAKVATENAKTD
ncbi:MAG: transcription termination/antitermination protein NusA [Acidobacteria bacterium]|nr:transcription termination/antitermination protein NusA [Acidobacteriota bacterium]MBI3657310.1 transcription termination/antitermination protein NusA [Acidobacteriota bacterium]